MIDSISAITLATHDMARAVRFYRVLGFDLIYGGDDAAFTSFRAGSSCQKARRGHRSAPHGRRPLPFHEDKPNAAARRELIPRSGADFFPSLPIFSLTPSARAHGHSDREAAFAKAAISGAVDHPQLIGCYNVRL
jgi:catechol 2,3-dioxygenase-like lactoylglutathione lyase family enzyme